MQANLPGPLMIKQGDSFHLEIIWEDSEGQPVDVTDCAARMHFREHPKSPLLLEMSTENGRVLLSEGMIEIRADSDVMKGFKKPEGCFDLEITYSDDRVATILSGFFKTIPDIAYDSDN